MNIDYVFSCWIYVITAGTSVIGFNQTGKKIDISTETTGTWLYRSITFKGTGTDLPFYLLTGTSSYKICMIKLEKGTRPSDWTYTQEEMQTKINTPTIYNPTLLNSWVNYGSEYTPVGYYKTVEGIVNLSGTIKDGTSSTGTILFTLPTGFRPLTRKNLIAQCSNGTAVNACQIDIDTSGNVTLKANGQNTWLSLDGVNFPTF